MVSATPTVVFVCEHGAAKSVIAAIHLARLAEAAGLTVQGLARGTDPEATLSPVAVDGLRADGLAVADMAPVRPSPEELSSAAAVVSFGPDLAHLVPDKVTTIYWTDVPAVSDDYDIARTAIVARLTPLLATLVPHPPPRDDSTGRPP